MTPLEKTLCDLIGGNAKWGASDKEDFEQLVEASFRHGIHLLVFDRIKKSSTMGNWPPHLRERLELAAAAAAALDLIREQELRRVLVRLDRYGVKTILMKGAPLAYSL